MMSDHLKIGKFNVVRNILFFLLAAAWMVRPAGAAEQEFIALSGWDGACNQTFCMVYQSYPDTIKNVNDTVLKNPAIVVAIRQDDPEASLITLIVPSDVDQSKGVSYLPIEKADPREWKPEEGVKAKVSGCDAQQCYVNPEEKAQFVLEHFFQAEGSLFFTFTQNGKVYNFKSDLTGFAEGFGSMKAFFQKKK